MDLERLEGAVRKMIRRGTEATLEDLRRRDNPSGELAWAAGTLAGRLEVAGPAISEDPRKPWM